MTDEERRESLERERLSLARCEREIWIAFQYQHTSARQRWSKEWEKTKMRIDALEEELGE